MTEPKTRTFMAALADCAIHGELTEDQAREWLSGADLALALRVIRSPRLHRKRQPPCDCGQPSWSSDAYGKYYCESCWPWIRAKDLPRSA